MTLNERKKWFEINVNPRSGFLHDPEDEKSMGIERNSEYASIEDELEALQTYTEALEFLNAAYTDETTRMELAEKNIVGSNAFEAWCASKGLLPDDHELEILPPAFFEASSRTFTVAV